MSRVPERVWHVPVNPSLSPKARFGMLPLAFGHYRVESELGRGGMGVVYRAFDERLHRPVALKVLTDEIAADPRRRSSILEEARASCSLNHPVITTVYEVGEDGDAIFIVMELVAGRTLRQAMTTRLDLLAVLRIAIQLTDALTV